MLLIQNTLQVFTIFSQNLPNPNPQLVPTDSITKKNGRTVTVTPTAAEKYWKYRHHLG